MTNARTRTAEVPTTAPVQTESQKRVFGDKEAESHFVRLAAVDVTVMAALAKITTGACLLKITDTIRFNFGFPYTWVRGFIDFATCALLKC